MLLLATAAQPELERYAHPCLGRLIQPRHFSSIERTAEALPWAADNDAFNDFNPARFVAMLDRIAGLPRCLFVATPDVVGDARATAELFEAWHGRLHETGLPIALVAQNGITQPPWAEIDALFVGGDDAFKMGPEVPPLVAEAKRRGKWVHMGRVNSGLRIRYAASIGCDSIDGLSFSRFRRAHLRTGLGHVAQLAFDPA